MLAEWSVNILEFPSEDPITGVDPSVACSYEKPLVIGIDVVESASKDRRLAESFPRLIMLRTDRTERRSRLARGELFALETLVMISDAGTEKTVFPGVVRSRLGDPGTWDPPCSNSKYL